MGDKNWDPATVFDLFGDSVVRRILVVASDAPVSANELVDRLDVSPPTVYRRINELLEHEFLAERRRIDEDGNQYRVFETTLRRIEFRVEDGGYDVDIGMRRDITDRFEAFWSDLERARPHGNRGSTERVDHTEGHDETHPS